MCHLASTSPFSFVSLHRPLDLDPWLRRCTTYHHSYLTHLIGNLIVSPASGRPPRNHDPATVEINGTYRLDHWPSSSQPACLLRIRLPGSYFGGEDPYWRLTGSHHPILRIPGEPQNIPVIHVGGLIKPPC